MITSIPTSTIDKFTTFGDLLRYLRRRAGITQTELSIAVGYSISQISRLEQNLRLPDIPTIQARFIAPLCLEDEPKALARLLELAAAVRREDAPASGLSPYKGLDYFDEADADMFVGREALTEKLIGRIHALASKTMPTQGRFFAIVGASGGGKSSLVRAGLVPALRWDKRSANWQIHILTPAIHPLESLATALARENNSLATIAALMDDLSADPRTLSLYIAQELKKISGAYFLLVIDQFEELFSLCRSEAERAAFINNLLIATSDEHGHAIVIITLRADFYAHCANYLPLREALAQHQEYIGAMSDEEMRHAIEEPAHRGRWEFEPGLIDLILHDVGHEPGALPLLSHALLETWQRRQGRTMTLSGYASAGGVRGAIAETAETVFTDQFTHQQQTIARRIFLRLTELGDETATGDTRRRATIQELIMKPEEADATQAVLKALADARLVTTGEDSVQVAHEALIREWPTLRGWLEENREGLRLHRQLTGASQEWLAAERGPDSLFRGTRLAQAREWAATHSDDMNDLEKEFLEASIAFSAQEAAEREAATQRELETAQKLADNERQRAKERGKAVILASGVGLLALILAVLAFFSWQQSAKQASVNLSLNLASAAQRAYDAGLGDLAIALAIESANQGQVPPEALQTLRSIAYSPGTRAILKGHSQSVITAAISSDAKNAFSASCAQMDTQGACQSGELILWDLGTLKELRRWTGHTGWVTSVAISLDGQLLISGAQDGTLFLWDLDGQRVGELAGHTKGITSLAVVPATGNLLSGSADGRLILWDLDTRKPLVNFDATNSPVTGISVAANAPRAVSGHEDGSLFLWGLNSSHHIFKKSLVDRVNAVAINSDGSKILFTTGVETNKYIGMLDGQSGELLKESFLGLQTANMILSSDGSTAFIPAISFIIQWDIQNWRQQAILMTLEGQINQIAADKNGAIALSAAMDGNLRVWDLNQLDRSTYITSAKTLEAIDITSDGKYLLLDDTSPKDGDQPGLWDIAQARVIKAYSGFDGENSPGSVAISPDDQYVAIAGAVNSTPKVMMPTVVMTPTVMIWGLEKGNVLCRIQTFKVMSRAVAFSPDSQYLLAGSQGAPTDRSGELILYNVKTCDEVRRFTTDKDVSSIVFSADGRYALTGSAFNSQATLWDVSTGQEINQYTYPAIAPVLGAVFGPSETTILASGEPDMHLWDLSSGELIRTYLGHSTITWGVAISPDGKYVLGGTLMGDVTLWDYATGKELSRFTLLKEADSFTFSPDSKTAYVTSVDGRLTEWRIAERSLPELLDWIKANRYVRELTCPEKLQYSLVDTKCK